MKTIQVAGPLAKRVNVAEFGIVTKQEFMERAKAAGWSVEYTHTNGYKNGEFNRTKYNRMAGDEQVEYEKRMNKVKTVYSIRIPGSRSFYDISKSEYEYFNLLTN